MKIYNRLIVLLLSLFLSNICFAEINTTPPSDGPVKVGISLYLENLSNVVPDIETVEFEFRFILTWFDPRLAFASSAASQKPKIYRRDAALKQLSEIWVPPYAFIDARGDVKSKGEQLIITPDGHVTLVRLISAEIETTINVKKFPFDEQTIEINIGQLLLSENNIFYVASTLDVGYDKEAELPEWVLLKYDTRVENNGKNYVFRIQLKHNSTFYIFRILLPFFIIIILSWLVFWIPREVLSHRLQFVLTTLLATLVFQWIIFKDIPHVSYPTFFGEWLFFSYLTLAFIIFILVADSLIPGPLAARINYHMRWIIVVFYLLGLACLGIYNFA